MTRVLRAEWTKLLTIRSTKWTMLAVFGLTVGLGALLAAGSESIPAGAGGDNDLVRDSLVGSYAAQFAVVAFGVLAFTSEYATRMILATFAAIPGRARVLVAKALLVGSTVFVVALATVATAFVLGQHLLRESGYSPPGYPAWSLADGPAQRAVLGTALFLSAVALLSLGVGAIVRHTAPAITSLLALLFIPLMFAPFLPERTRELVQQVTPGAGFAVQQTVPRGDALPIDP